MYYIQRHKMALIFLGLLWGGVYAWALCLKKEGGSLPIRSIAVEMTSHSMVSEAVLDKIELWREEGRLLQVRLSDIYQDIIEFPWVKAVQIWRIWPDRLKIRIEPHQIRAKWRQGDTVSAVTLDGVLLAIDKKMMPDDLPILEGPADRVSEVWHIYQQLQGLFNGIPLKVTSLRLVGESYWEIRLDNEIAIILGKEGVKEQVLRLIRVLQQPLKSLVNRIAYIDLRYPAGLAVGWKH
ncbi:MAG TPA: cell division protein FtsQ/DivIB [Gammaproteobacteria bacterium]|nr:cell division protein FtsQ/DivIB [Gammaproteobacteria bacterium]